jgi:large subunit ribosomal protein L5e
MPFVKLVKNKAYFKRFQVKYRRRREGKTDFRARRGMVLQDKTKYGAPKYRLVVRFTNKDVIAQIVHAEVAGDKVLQAAYSHELPAYGVKFGLTNYAAAYATGLLLARRTLKKLNIADKFEGAKATGEYTAVRVKGGDDESTARFPFRAILDVGLARTTTGAKIFGVMKGVVDGGVAVPHKPNRFPGFNKAKGDFNAKVLRERIFGGHVASYMKKVADKKKENADFKTTQFAKFGELKAADLEGLYKKAHEAIRKDPSLKPAKKNANGAATRKSYAKKRLTVPQRREAVAKKIQALRKKLKA